MTPRASTGAHRDAAAALARVDALHTALTHIVLEGGDLGGIAAEVARVLGCGVLVTSTDGRERLYGSYVKVEPPLKIYARGLAVFNDDKQEFDHLAEVEMSAPAFPTGHAFRHSERGVEYIYFANPYPLTRVRATAESFQRIADYECYTCLKSGSRLDEQQVERDRQGRLVYAWKKNTPAVGPAAQARLIAAGKIKSDEALLRLGELFPGHVHRAGILGEQALHLLFEFRLRLDRSVGLLPRHLQQVFLQVNVLADRGEPLFHRFHLPLGGAHGLLAGRHLLPRLEQLLAGRVVLARRRSGRSRRRGGLDR